MYLAIQGRTLVALAILAALLAASRMTHGEDPQCKCKVQIKVQGDGSSLLGEIPYVGRFFQNLGVEHACPAEAERIGVDFDVLPGKVVEFHGPIGFGVAGCEVCPLPPAQAIVVTHAEKTCAAGECTAAARCCAEGKCCAAAQCCAEGQCCAAGKCCPERCRVAAEEKSELWEHLAELTAENAALEATLEGHEAILEAKAEMFESLAELMVEKAKLEAKLEMVEHRDSMLKEMVELQAENARLKAQAELAQQKEDLLKAQVVTVLENERLKQRVAELEQRQAAGDEPVLTAKKAQKPKKAR